jgi:hypothetical protein
MSSSKKKGRGYIVYKSYVFRDKDPIIDVCRTIVKKSGLSYQQVSDESNVSVSCIRAQFHGVTKKPQHATVAAIIGACGYEFPPPRKKTGK